MIRFGLTLLAVASFAFVTANTVRAADEVKEEVVEGVVKSVDGEKAVFVIIVAEKEVEVKTTDKTKFVGKDGKEGKMADVVVKDAKVSVSHTAGTASSVTAK